MWCVHGQLAMTSSADRCSLTSLDSEDERTWHSLTAVPISPALLDEFITDDSDYWQLDDTDLYKGSNTTPRQGIFQDLEHGGVNQPLGVPSFPFSSPLSFLPPSPSPLSLLSPWSRGVLCESWGVLTPLRGVGNSLRHGLLPCRPDQRHSSGSAIDSQTVMYR